MIIDHDSDTNIIVEDLHRKLKCEVKNITDFERENLISLINELKSQYPQLNHYWLYNVKLDDVYRIISEDKSTLGFDLTVKEPVTAELINFDENEEVSSRVEKSILLLLVLLLFLEHSHLVLTVSFKKNKGKPYIPFQSYFSFLSRNSLMVTEKYNQKFHYSVSVHSALLTYSSNDYFFNDQIDRFLQIKINKSVLTPESLFNFPVGSELQKYEKLHTNTAKVAGSLAHRLAANNSSIFNLHNKIRLI